MSFFLSHVIMCIGISRTLPYSASPGNLICWKIGSMSESNAPRILVIGKSSPLLEGVGDLLQLSGYQVDTSSSWTETEYAMHVTPPDLAIVDVSSPTADAHRLSEQIHSAPRWSRVPILFISFSGDDRIRELQGYNHKSNGGRLDFYAHTLLSMNGFLEKVKTCLV
jgi:response regulator RpfG family c-di-GMP phosphodiesterase